MYVSSYCLDSLVTETQFARLGIIRRQHFKCEVEVLADLGWVVVVYFLTSQGRRFSKFSYFFSGCLVSLGGFWVGSEVKIECLGGLI